jgi:hypothetical protein
MIEDKIWEAIAASGPSDGVAIFDPLLTDDVLSAERSMMQYDRRKSFVAAYAWAVPTREAIQRIHAAVGDRRLLEVCAGMGLWSKLLSDAGNSVVATDAAPPASSPYLPVQTMDAEAAVKQHPACGALLMCWPPFKDGCALRAVRAFRGDRLVYIGDPRFTANEPFHALLASSWHLLEQISLPSWPGTKDAVGIYASRQDVSSRLKR